MSFQQIGTITPRARCASGGSYGWLTPYIASIAVHNEEIAARSLFLTRAELHFIAMCTSLMGKSRDDRDHYAAFARGLGVVSRRTLIENACDLGSIDATPGLAQLPAQLAGNIWRPASYIKLATLMAEPSAKKALRHLPRITRGNVITLARLPEAYRTHGVLRMIKKRSDLAEVLFALELVRRVRIDLNDQQVLASLEKAEARSMRAWVMKHYEQAPFPPAPVGPIMLAGVEAMRPLSCYDDLARAAREFDNCIRTYLWAVLKGDSYFYRYAPNAGGKGVAIIELRRTPVIGWIVHEALGPKNDDLTAMDRAIIVNAFSDAGISPAPQMVSPNAWFDFG